MSFFANPVIIYINQNGYIAHLYPVTPIYWNPE